MMFFCFFFSSRRRHTRLTCDWSSDVCSSDLRGQRLVLRQPAVGDLRGRVVVRRPDVHRLGLLGGRHQVRVEPVGGRSEEGRVGEECRFWGAPYNLKKKKKKSKG